jgi:hypothetical protein
VVGHHLADTFEAAALEAINIFCDQHPDEVARWLALRVEPLKVSGRTRLAVSNNHHHHHQI